VRVSRITGASDYSSLSLRSLVALAHAPTLATTEQGLAGAEFRLVHFKAKLLFPVLLSRFNTSLIQQFAG
jgi:hypothetical protein